MLGLVGVLHTMLHLVRANTWSQLEAVSRISGIFNNIYLSDLHLKLFHIFRPEPLLTCDTDGNCKVETGNSMWISSIVTNIEENDFM